MYVYETRDRKKYSSKPAGGRSREAPFAGRMAGRAIQLCGRRVFIRGKEFSVLEAKRILTETPRFHLVPAQVNYYFETMETGDRYFKSWEDLGLAVLSDIEGGQLRMSDVAEVNGCHVSNYLAPENRSRTGVISPFNKMLTDIFGKKAVSGPFTVIIEVGDLEGFGDITAGAKLARALADFYSGYEMWKDVRVHLYLQKYTNLKGKKTSERETIKKITNSIIEGTSVRWVEEDSEDISGPKIEVGYPAHNIGGVDFKIQQYGYQQFGSDQDYGSGPGFGSLGTLMPEESQIESAVKIAERKGEGHPNMKALFDKLTEFNITDSHFAYYSKYQERYKDFFKKISLSADCNTAVIFSKFAGELKTVAESMRDSYCNKKTEEIIGDNEKKRAFIDKYTNNKRKPKDGALKRAVNEEMKSQFPFKVVAFSYMHKKGTKNEQMVEEDGLKNRAAGSKTILLINFPEGVSNQEMMALYYLSTGEVGATGDQSFMEAYAMRRRKKKSAPSERGDIIYDVPEQQRKLYRQLQELQENKYLSGKGPQGLQIVSVNEAISHAIDTKPLLFPVVALINDQLIKKKAESGQNCL